MLDIQSISQQDYILSYPTREKLYFEELLNKHNLRLEFQSFYKVRGIVDEVYEKNLDCLCWWCESNRWEFRRKHNI